MRFYRSFKASARKIFVLTTSNRRFLPQDEFEYAHQDVIEIRTIDFRTIYHFLTGSHGSLITPKTSLQSSWLLRWKEWFKQSILSRYFDDGGWVYIQSGFRSASKIIQEEGIDIIVSSYMPLDAHRLAWKLKKKFPHLYWIADFRDFMGDPMLPQRVGSKYKRELTLQMLKDVDEVITVSEGLKQRINCYHPQVFVVRNGVDQNLLTKEYEKKYDLFTLAYTGIIYPDAQKADILGQALQNLIRSNQVLASDIQVIQAGKDGYFWKDLLEQYGLSHLLINESLLPHKEALRIQRRAHMNVLLSWSSLYMQGILTGKLYEYIASGNPILAIVNGVKDKELENIIEGHGFGAVFYHRQSAVAQVERFILSQYQKWQQGNTIRPLPAAIREKLMPFMWDTGFEQWAQEEKENQQRKNFS